MRYTVILKTPVLQHTEKPWRLKTVVGFAVQRLYIEVAAELDAQNIARSLDAKQLLRGQHGKVECVPCDRCSGRGVYYWGAIVNGVPTHSGPCFRCESKGYQDDADKRRNYGYDMHQRVF